MDDFTDLAIAIERAAGMHAETVTLPTERAMELMNYARAGVLNDLANEAAFISNRAQSKVRQIAAEAAADISRLADDVRRIAQPQTRKAG